MAALQVGITSHVKGGGAGSSPVRGMKYSGSSGGRALKYSLPFLSAIVLRAGLTPGPFYFYSQGGM